MELRKREDLPREVEDKGEEEGERPPGKPGLHKCDRCGTTFTHLARLRRHYRSHSGERPYVCEVCNKDFAVKENLTVHMRTHTKEKPYVCEDCGKGFEHSGKLRRHEKIHSGERPHVCQICGKGFIQSGQLTIHMRMHSGEKPYQCENCDKKFAGAKQLKVHERTHTGERPYQCPECKKNFAYSHVLKFHQLSHSSEKQYRCLCCQSIFSRRAELNAHIRVCANLESSSGVEINEPSTSGTSGSFNRKKLPRLSEAWSPTQAGSSSSEESVSPTVSLRRDSSAHEGSSPDSELLSSRYRKRYTDSDPDFSTSPKKSAVDTKAIAKKTLDSNPGPALPIRKRLVASAYQSDSRRGASIPKVAEKGLHVSKLEPDPPALDGPLQGNTKIEPEPEPTSTKGLHVFKLEPDPPAVDGPLQGSTKIEPEPEPTSTGLPFEKRTEILIPKLEPDPAVLTRSLQGTTQQSSTSEEALREKPPSSNKVTETNPLPHIDLPLYGALQGGASLESAQETRSSPLPPQEADPYVLQVCTVASDLSTLDLSKPCIVETTELPSLAFANPRPVIVYSTCSSAPGFPILSYSESGSQRPVISSRSSETEEVIKKSQEKGPEDIKPHSHPERGESVIKFAGRPNK